MTHRQAFITALLLAFCIHPAFAISRKDTLSVGAKAKTEQEKIDSAYLAKVKLINDYSLLGIQYGIAFSNVSFQPNRSSDMSVMPVNVGLVYTKYGKMFGYMPYFGIQLGFFYTQEAYHFSTSDSGYTDQILGAAKATYQVLELPVMAHFHYDFWKMKVMANVGIYGGYRLTIHRDEYTSQSYYDTYGKYQDCFHEKENRWDYGIKAGAGFGFILDPIEIHLMAWFKYSWSNLHQPNCDRFYEESKYYYYWSYPMNIIVSVGVNYQLSKRNGLTKKELKQQAMSEVVAAAKRAKEISDSVAKAQIIDSLALIPKIDSLELAPKVDSLMASPLQIQTEEAVRQAESIIETGKKTIKKEKEK